MQGLDRAATSPPEVPAGEAGKPDPLYDQAVKVVRKNNKASISLVQRHLQIGYNRAARLLEDMEKAGAIGPMNTAGQREILEPAPDAPAAADKPDPLYDQALALIIKEQKANVRLFKVGLGIGTAKAMQLMDILEHAKKVSACDERGARKVLVEV